METMKIEIVIVMTVRNLILNDDRHGQKFIQTDSPSGFCLAENRVRSRHLATPKDSEHQDESSSIYFQSPDQLQLLCFFITKWSF